MGSSVQGQIVVCSGRTNRFGTTALPFRRGTFAPHSGTLINQPVSFSGGRLCDGFEGVLNGQDVALRPLAVPSLQSLRELSGASVAPDSPLRTKRDSIKQKRQARHAGHDWSVWVS